MAQVQPQTDLLQQSPDPHESPEEVNEGQSITHIPGTTACHQHGTSIRPLEIVRQTGKVFYPHFGRASIYSFDVVLGDLGSSGFSHEKVVLELGEKEAIRKGKV